MPYLSLLINCVYMRFTHFHHVDYLILVYVRHFLKHVFIFLVLFGALFSQTP